MQNEKRLVSELLGMGRKALASVESYCTKLGPCVKRGLRWPGDDCGEKGCFYYHYFQGRRA